jgi:hypothetical protein
MALALDSGSVAQMAVASAARVKTAIALVFFMDCLIVLIINFARRPNGLAGFDGLIQLICCGLAPATTPCSLSRGSAAVEFQARCRYSSTGIANPPNDLNQR